MPTTDTTTGLRLRRARRSLTRAGILEGAKDTRVTARVRKRLLDAAHSRTGIASETDPITAGLTLFAAQDDFGAWLATQRGALSDDFDIGL